MDNLMLKEANKLKKQIDDISNFICSCERNCMVRFYKKKSLMVTVSDYMGQAELFQLSSSQKEKLIAVLKEERAELQKRFDELN